MLFKSMSFTTFIRHNLHPADYKFNYSMIICNIMTCFLLTKRFLRYGFLSFCKRNDGCNDICILRYGRLVVIR